MSDSTRSITKRQVQDYALKVMDCLKEAVKETQPLKTIVMGGGSGRPGIASNLSRKAISGMSWLYGELENERKSKYDFNLEYDFLSNGEFYCYHLQHGHSCSYSPEEGKIKTIYKFGNSWSQYNECSFTLSDEQREKANEGIKKLFTNTFDCDVKKVHGNAHRYVPPGPSPQVVKKDQ